MNKQSDNGKDGKTVSLVLGSGGARGLAHIGVIHWLEEHGFHIASISGCSVGAMVGGIYAAGHLDEFEAWVRSITRMDLVALMDLSWGKSGLVKGDKVISTLVGLVGDQCIEDLPIPFTAVATDMLNEKEVWLTSGSLFDAIRASCSIPFFLTPVRLNGVELIDGGVLNPVPIAPTFGDSTEMTLAVNLGGPAEEPLGPEVEHPEPVEASSTMRRKINRFIHRFKNNGKEAPGRDWGVYGIAHQAFDAMQGTIARQKLAAYPPDRLVVIPKNACGTLEVYRAAEMIELGYRRAERCFSELLA
ncbi:patatin-like phospholipase family protein [Desulfoluna spongiiphila]|uniref:NTE family protein n=1 Tax=Desulfoluna spongiiphila TaxID=419481 RepID=A0A1G5CSU2_9BACT|nr:patatin-like phospholipase family protein [Desulfoluna spongiiphila]SCY05328.1 NTE family protein [Desulfoluna spongiiphila]